MFNKFKGLIGFGRKEVEGYEEVPPDYGLAVAIGCVAFRIGYVMQFEEEWRCDDPFLFKVNYLIEGPYGKQQQDLCIAYELKSGWFISIPYLDLTLDKWDFKAICIAIKNKVQGKTIPDGFRYPPLNIYVDNTQTDIDWAEEIKKASKKNESPS